jgi:DNA-binding GntR family transcriptional regulator
MPEIDIPKAVDEHAAASLVSQVVEGIIDGVMAGRYVQGQRLVAADLAEQFGVSRAPVREALHVLAGEGVVELLPNRGARIRRLSVADRVDFLEFTEALLVLGVRLAAGKMTEDRLHARVREAFKGIEQAWEARQSLLFVKALYQYHVVLNEIAANSFLDFFYSRPYIRFYTLLLADLAPGDHWERFIDNYRQIHETILLGDAHTAVVTFCAHMRWVLRIMPDNAKKL